MNAIEKYLAAKVNGTQVRVGLMERPSFPNPMIFTNGDTKINAFVYLDISGGAKGAAVPAVVREDFLKRLKEFLSTYSYDNSRAIREAAREAMALAEEIRRVAEVTEG